MDYRGLFSSNTDEWYTPLDFYEKLNEEFHFDLDPCATAENHKCDRYFTREDDGLSKSWGGVQSVLQSSLRPCNRKLGSERIRRVKEGRHACGHVAACPDGHKMVS